MTRVVSDSISDFDQRRRALDITRSFIVQAPAGSGKTELLTQRFLGLLAQVEKPEEILAMTFTRKAAGEMRDRIYSALIDAQNAVPVDEPHRAATRELAMLALERDRERVWNLLEHPSRLRVTTIDGFNATLARAVPLLAGSGLSLAISDDPRALYEEAALRQMQFAGHDADTPEAGLLAHLDNRLSRCVDLLAEALAARDLWLETIVSAGTTKSLREYLETALNRQIQRQVHTIREALGRDSVDRIKLLLAAAVENKPELLSDRAVADFSAAEDRPWFWRLAAHCLLKANGASWRAQVTKAHGFPPKDPHKAEIVELLAEQHDDDDAAIALDELRLMPVEAYPDGQWEILEKLLTVLPACAAQLQLVFMERGEADYAAVSHAALSSLGGPQAPSDLALALDYRIRHILIDEFQDTSRSQVNLLNLLTQGWEDGDGRSLMLVGDPMQSIYRFRKAEVALFMDCQQRGLDGGRVKLESLALSANFRSQRGLVHWCNDTFATLMAGAEDLPAGKVGFSVSESVRDIEPGDAVTVWPQTQNDRQSEADKVARIAKDALALSGQTVAVLVRARSHLEAILPALRRTGLRFKTIDTERLAQRQVIQDLLAVTRAVLHPADRAAWLAMLRAPWSGIALTDLSILLGDSRTETIPEILLSFSGEGMTEDGWRRVQRVTPLLLQTMEQRGRRRLRENVEGLWLALGGAAILDDPADLDNADSYFRLLETHDRAGEPVALGTIERHLERLYAAPDPDGDPRLQVMTIYAAKGLEFDTVIVPGLGRRAKDPDKPLLRWANVVDPDHGQALLMAPLSASGDQSDRFFAYLKRLAQRRDHFETDRLLYVACTRAKQRLHLLGHATISAAHGEPYPDAGSLLRRLWPAIAPHFLAHRDEDPAQPTNRDTDSPAVSRRLPTDWHAPQPPVIERIHRQQASTELGTAIEFDWAQETVRLIGTVVHRELELIGRGGPAGWNDQKIASRKDWWRTSLLAHGLPASSLAEAIITIERALQQTLADRRGRWILDPAHADARSEWALTGDDQGRHVNVVLDRSFVDSDGLRWIIDYKTSRHEGSDLDAFIAEQRERYASQLERYARLIAGLEQRPQRLGLYFPLLGRWIEWAPENTPE